METEYLLAGADPKGVGVQGGSSRPTTPIFMEASKVLQILRRKRKKKEERGGRRTS
jgi:hypothetical protein